MSISPPPKWSQGAQKINMVEIQCTEKAEYILFRTQHCRKYASHEKKLQIKVIWNWISYEKVRECVIDFLNFRFRLLTATHCDCVYLPVVWYFWTSFLWFRIIVTLVNSTKCARHNSKLCIMYPSNKIGTNTTKQLRMFDT